MAVDTRNFVSADSFIDEYNMALNLQPVCEVEEVQDFSEDYRKILSMTNMSIKMLSTSYYKESTYLEACDIDQIKASLNNYANKDQKVLEFKQNIIHDLTQFQRQIKDKHLQEVIQITKQHQEFVKMVTTLEAEKEQLVRSRLAKMAWPYDAKTKEYDNKIAMAKARVEQFAQKVEALKDKKPVASEKDIIVFQMSLKEKFAA